MSQAARRPALAALLAALLLPLPCASARAEAPEEIDRAVQELAAFVQRALPDRAGDSLLILPFLSEEGDRTVLGERLAAELELALARAYRRTRLGGGANRTFTLSGQLQTYASRLRVLCRLQSPGGAQVAASRVELRMSSELQALLAAPSGSEFSGQGLHGPGGQDSPAATGDPLEPDDSPGAEIQLTGAEGLVERYLSPGDFDRFRFYAGGGPGASVRLVVQTTLDAQLVLYREGETVPFRVLGNSSGASILFEERLAPGYYVAELLAFRPEVQGPYTIRFEPAPPAGDSFEPDDTPAEARALAPETSQERTLSAEDPDWVELTPSPPGFYSLFTSGLEVDTSLTLFREGRVPVLADEDGGPQSNAFLCFFLGGQGRWLARVEGKGPLAAGRYTLSFQSLAPELIGPRVEAHRFVLSERPTALQLRILREGRYLVRCPGVALELYGLPALRLQPEGPALLAAGDYLLLLKGLEGQSASLTVTEE